MPELDREGWTANDFVRDFDIDYTLLLENLVDPDHGLYAHQVRHPAARTPAPMHLLTCELGHSTSSPGRDGTACYRQLVRVS